MSFLNKLGIGIGRRHEPRRFEASGERMARPADLGGAQAVGRKARRARMNRE